MKKVAKDYFNMKKSQLVTLIKEIHKGVLKEGSGVRDLPMQMLIQMLVQRIVKAEKNRKVPHKDLTKMSLGDLQKYYNSIEQFDDTVHVPGQGWGGVKEATYKPDESFFERLDQALNSVEEYLDKNKAVVDDNEHPKEEQSDRHGIRKAFAYGGIPYEQTREAHYKLLAFKGKLTRKYLHVSIYRMPSGSYELTRYIA